MALHVSHNKLKKPNHNFLANYSSNLVNSNPKVHLNIANLQKSNRINYILDYKIVEIVDKAEETALNIKSWMSLSRKCLVFMSRNLTVVDSNWKPQTLRKLNKSLLHQPFNNKKLKKINKVSQQ